MQINKAQIEFFGAKIELYATFNPKTLTNVLAVASDRLCTIQDKNDSDSVAIIGAGEFVVIQANESRADIRLILERFDAAVEIMFLTQNNKGRYFTHDLCQFCAFAVLPEINTPREIEFLEVLQPEESYYTANGPSRSEYMTVGELFNREIR